MIAIKDMEMPKCCFQCDFYSNEYGCKLKFTDECNPSVEKPDDCPLVEIVTCKDCKYFVDEDGHGYYCKKSDTERIPTCADFYCIHGERRE